MKRVIIVPDFPPKRALGNVRESYQAAAKRWDAELIWFTECSSGGHCFWRKMQAFSAVASRYDQSHVLQLDNDMLIREDCPSPFDLVSPTEFAMVAGRQRPDRRVDEHSWGAKAHNIWATRMNTKQLPPALHPNGGLYLYGLPHFSSLWQRIDQASKRWGNHGDLGADESIIGNLLWSRHRQAIRFLPQEFNTVLCQNAALLRDGYSPTYITHYAMGAKGKLADAKWQTSDWPWTGDDAVRELSNQIRRRKHDVGCLLNPESETVCKLLILFPELYLCGVHAERTENITAEPTSAKTLLSVSHTSYLLVRQILADLGPLSRRYRPIFCQPDMIASAGPFDFVVDAGQRFDSQPTVDS